MAPEAPFVAVPEPALELAPADGAVVAGEDDPLPELLEALELDALLLDEVAGGVDDWVEVVLGAGVVDVFVASGSMYCWFPADVVVPPP